MVELIRLANFQRHSRLELPLDPKITTIAGPSDVGKSSILRALRWVALNNPQGDSFVREGSKGTTVQVRVDGHTVTRKRGGSLNSYEVEGDEYKAFGTSVPDRVASLLNLSETNFQDQHDAAYWLSLSSAEVSRQLNAIVDLGVIDSAFASIGARVRSLQQKSGLLLERVRVAKQTKESLDWVTEAAEQFAEVESAQTKRTKLTDRVDCLRRIVAQVAKLRDVIREEQERYDDLVVVGKSYKAAVDLQATRSKLAEVVATASRARCAAKQTVPDHAELDKAIEQWQQAKKRLASLRTLVVTVRDCEGKLDKRRKAYKAAESSVREVGGVVCPTCNQPVETGA
jgi:exonuclease SbcC